MRIACLALALLAAGCSDSGIAPAADGRSLFDASPRDLVAVGDGGAPFDLAAPPDLAPPAGAIPCAAASCATPKQACCSATFGTTGACVAMAEACAVLADRKYACDGPEDCAPAEACCYTASAGSVCTAANACTGGAVDRRPMCHDGKVCGGLTCCALGKIGPWSACIAGPCPK